MTRLISWNRIFAKANLIIIIFIFTLSIEWEPNFSHESIPQDIRFLIDFFDGFIFYMEWKLCFRLAFAYKTRAHKEEQWCKEEGMHKRIRKEYEKKIEHTKSHSPFWSKYNRSNKEKKRWMKNKLMKSSFHVNKDNPERGIWRLEKIFDVCKQPAL